MTTSELHRTADPRHHLSNFHRFSPALTSTTGTAPMLLCVMVNPAAITRA